MNEGMIECYNDLEKLLWEALEPTKIMSKSDPSTF